jgi:FAD/FMN-containing dehydrogenase
MAIVLVILASVAVGGGWKYAADPDGEKDCGPVAPRAAAPDGRTINDVSCLNPTPVRDVIAVKTVGDITAAVARARQEGLKLSIAGARHSQGGHAFAPGAIVLDMRGFNSMSLDENARVLTVQSGATWHDIQKYLHPRFAVKAMQSTDLFTVGGSISVNAHGMDHQAGSVGGTIRSMRVMTADGEIHQVSRTEDLELFRLVVGGYGLFGIILDADLDITENAVYRSGREIVDYTDFPAFFAGRIQGDQSYRLLYAHLSTAPQSFLRETIVYTYQQVPADASKIPPLDEVGSVRLRRFVFNFSKMGSLPMRLKWWAEKHIEPRIESCPAGDDNGCLVSRNHPMHDSVPYLMNSLAGETDILQEYFIPRDQLVPFVDGLRRIATANRANLLNASIRVVHREDNFLNYAPGDMFAIVLYLNQKTTASGVERMAMLTRELIDLTIASNGRFFLPYQLHYTPAQLRRSYPEIEDFFRAKDRYDPGHLLTNTFYNKYAPTILAGQQP